MLVYGIFSTGLESEKTKLLTPKEFSRAGDYTVLLIDFAL